MQKAKGFNSAFFTVSFSLLFPTQLLVAFKMIENRISQFLPQKTKYSWFLAIISL